VKTSPPGPAAQGLEKIGLLRCRLEVDLVEKQHWVLGSRNEIKRADAGFSLGSDRESEGSGLGDEARERVDRTLELRLVGGIRECLLPQRV